jgi:hypothetical protein
MPSARASQEAVTMSSETPTVVHSPSGSAEVTRTRVTARVPARPSRMRTLKSTSWTSFSSGWRGLRARRRAWSRALEGERRVEAAPLATDQQLEGGVGDLEGIAAVLQLLDPVEDAGPEGGVGVQVEAELARLGQDVGAAGQLRDQHPGLVADPARVDVAVGVGPAGDGRGVQAGLGGEGGRADIGLAVVGGQVGQLGDGVGGGGEGGQPVAGQQLEALLELEAGDDGEQVGVAAALAVAVGRPLDVAGTGLDRDQRVGHRAGRVVVEVDPDPDPGREGVPDLADDPVHGRGQAAAVGVAEHHGVGAGGGRRLDNGQGVGRVGGVAVEEVLGVEGGPPPGGHQVGDRVADHGQVLVEGGPQGLGDVQVPGLADQGDDRGPRVQQGAQVGVVVDPAAGPAGGPEGGQGGVTPGQLGGPGEVLGVLGVGAGPAALDHVDAEVVEEAGDPQLVGHGELEADLLGAVAEGGVVGLYVLVGGHAWQGGSS